MCAKDCADFVCAKCATDAAMQKARNEQLGRELEAAKRETVETAKDLADARAEAMRVAPLRAEIAAADKERMRLETMLFDAMATLQWYAEERHWSDSKPTVYKMVEGDEKPTLVSAGNNSSIDIDDGKRARVTLRKLVEAGDAFAKEKG